MKRPHSGSVAVDPPEGYVMPALSAEVLVEHARMTWKAAKVAHRTDCIALVLESADFQAKVRAGVEVGVSSFTNGCIVSAAAGCASILEPLMANTDDPRIALCVSMLKGFVAEEIRKR